MAVFEFILHEDIFYEYYMHRINCLVIPKYHSLALDTKKWDTIILHCYYANGKLNSGRYLSPIYRTVTDISTANVTDVEFNFIIISIK